jgi:hypothetical protein
MKLGSLWVSVAATMFALGWSVAWSADAVTNCLIVSLGAQGTTLGLHYFK